MDDAGNNNLRASTSHSADCPSVESISPQNEPATGGDPALRELREMLLHQSTLLTTFMHQQNVVNERFRIAIGQSIAVMPEGPNTNAVGTIGQPPAPVHHDRSFSLGAPAFISTPRSGEERGNITHNLSQTLPSAAVADVSAEWKNVALALSKSANKATVEKPMFRSPESHHPVTFIKRLERFVRAVGASPVEQVDIAKECFLGPASDWKDMREGGWTHFEIFKRDFLEHYWSEERQYSERVRLGNMRHLPDKPLSMAEFFLRQVTSYQLFTPPIPETLILSDVMRQMPLNIQSLWATVSDRTISGALNFLERQVSIAGKRLRSTAVINNIHSNTATSNSRFSFNRSATSTKERHLHPPIMSANISNVDFSLPPPTVCTVCHCNPKAPLENENREK